jgi:hypothetical protein
LPARRSRKRFDAVAKEHLAMSKNENLVRQRPYPNWQLAREKIRPGKAFNNGNAVLFNLKRP